MDCNQNNFVKIGDYIFNIMKMTRIHKEMGFNGKCITFYIGDHWFKFCERNNDKDYEEAKIIFDKIANQQCNKRK